MKSQNGKKPTPANQMDTKLLTVGDAWVWIPTH